MQPNFELTKLSSVCAVQDTYFEIQSPTNVPKPETAFLDKSQMENLDKVKLYAYYGWTFVALIVQAIFFVVPYFVWKSWEGGKIEILINDITLAVKRKDSEENIQQPLIEYFFTNSQYAYGFMYKQLICELLNLIIVVGQVCVLNVFIGETFTAYGLYRQVFDPQATGSIMQVMKGLFPPTILCAVSKNTGIFLTFDNYRFCSISQNLINAKICVILWFWFHILAFMNAVVLIYRIITLFSLSIRSYEPSNCKMTKTCESILLRTLSIESRFLLQMLRQDMDELAYKELKCHIAQRLSVSLRDDHDDKRI